MTNAARLALVLVATTAAPALADDAPVTHTDQLVVVTPNAPIVVTPDGAAAQAPGAVVAQPALQTAAPHNEEWSNVSHINGTPVKVGERNEYLYTFKKTNISTNPIGWMFGVYGLSVSQAVHNNIAIRVDGNLFHNFMDEGMNGYEVGISAPIYFKRAYQGPFIEPGLVVRGIQDSYTDYAYDGTVTTMQSSMDTSFGPEVLFGWHSTFDSGLNVSAAAGAMRNLNVQTDEYGYTEDEMEFVGYFRAGYAF